MNKKITKNINGIQTIAELDKNNLVLFVGPSFLEKYINSHLKTPIKNYLTCDMKDVNTAGEIINNIITRVKTNNNKLIFVIYNCVFVSNIIKTVQTQNLNVPIIAWHQKHYFKANCLPSLFAVMEYSVIQAKKQKHYNKNYANKYIYIPYPSILPKNYNEIIEKESYKWKDRYTGKYIFVGGNNGRDFKTMFQLIESNPDMKMVILCSDKKSINRINSMKKKYKTAMANISYYFDSDSYQFAYAIQHCHFMILPFVEPKSMAGHSVVAQAVYFGKPVITNLYSSMDEAVRDGENGYLVKCLDFDAYQKYSKMIWNDDTLHKKLSIQMEKDALLRDYPHYEYMLVKYSKKALLNEPL